MQLARLSLGVRRPKTQTAAEAASGFVNQRAAPMTTLCKDDTICFLPACAAHGCMSTDYDSPASMSQLEAQLEGLAIGLEQRGEKSAAHICRRAVAELVASRSARTTR